MSVVTQGQILVQGNSANPTTIIGGDGGISPLPYLSITYSGGSSFTVDSSFYEVRPFPTITFPFTWSVINWGDGIIERNIPNTTEVTHSYSSAGTYTANFYTLASNLNRLGSIQLDNPDKGISNVIGYNIRSAFNLNSLECVLNPISSFNVSYLPLLEYFDFSYCPNLTYTSGDLGKNNPHLKFINLNGCGLNTNEVNNVLVDIQTYCINNSGSLYLTGSGTEINAAPTVGPPNGIAAKNALTASGWLVQTF